jgi:hypothetical protein
MDEAKLRTRLDACLTDPNPKVGKIIKPRTDLVDPFPPWG